jgi:hypothetical protein
MSRFILALRCFFAVLLRLPLPPQAATLLLKDQAPLLPPVPPPPPVEVAHPPAPKPAPTPSLDEARDERVPTVHPERSLSEPSEPSEPKAESKAESKGVSVHRGAVQLLGVLQREGRLLDFLMEDIDSYSDAQIGAAVRDIHRGCRKALGEHLRVRPIRSEPDEAVVRIPEGYDPSRIRLVGRVTGRPPFEGTLRHHGWCTGEINLSDIPAGHDPTVICPAEVELGA